MEYQTTTTDTQAAATPPPGYKPSLLGPIPEDWDVKPLSSIATVNPKRAKHLEDDDLVTFVEMAAVSEEGHLTDGEPRLYAEVRSGFSAFRDRDVLVAKITPCFENGKGALVDGLANGHGFGSTEFLVIRPKEGVDPRFVWLHTRTDRFRGTGESNMTGSAGQKRVPSDFLRLYRLPVPPRDEMHRIGNESDRWDTAIKQLDSLITRKEDRQRGLMQQLFPEHGATAPGLRLRGGSSRPWVKRRIDEMMRVVKRPVEWDDEAVYELITVKRGFGGIVLREALRGHEIKTKALWQIREGDFLISRRQIVHGASAVVDAESDGRHVSSSYAALRPRDSESVDVRYFKWVSRTPWFRHLTYITSHGVHIEKLFFDLQGFLRRTLYVPPTIEEQRAIADVLDAGEREIRLIRRERQALLDQKKGLMQRLLTGRVRVPEADMAEASS